jgi:hypothetical protein
MSEQLTQRARYPYSRSPELLAAKLAGEGFCIGVCGKVSCINAVGVEVTMYVCAGVEQGDQV